MSNIPSVENRIQIEGTRTRSPVSESLEQTMGGSINYALDHIDAIEAHDLVQDAQIAALEAAPKLQNTAGQASYTNSFTTVYTAPTALTSVMFSFRTASQFLGSGVINAGATETYADQGLVVQARIVGNAFQIKDNVGGGGTVVFSAFYYQ